MHLGIQTVQPSQCGARVRTRVVRDSNGGMQGEKELQMECDVYLVGHQGLRRLCRSRQEKTLTPLVAKLFSYRN